MKLLFAWIAIGLVVGIRTVLVSKQANQPSPIEIPDPVLFQLISTIPGVRSSDLRADLEENVYLGRIILENDQMDPHQVLKEVLGILRMGRLGAWPAFSVENSQYSFNVGHLGISTRADLLEYCGRQIQIPCLTSGA